MKNPPLFQVCVVVLGPVDPGSGVTLINSRPLTGMTNFPGAVNEKFDAPFVPPPQAAVTGWPIRGLQVFKSAKFFDKTKVSSVAQTDTSLLPDWLPVPPPAEITLQCLVHVITSNWQIVGSDQTEIVSLCLINTYLIMVNYQCLIMEEQSCQPGDEQEPSGSLINICRGPASLC